MSHHSHLHDVASAAGDVFCDALLSIFAGHDHHDPWEAAVERWDREHPRAAGPAGERPGD